MDRFTTMIDQRTNYGFGVTINASFADTLERTKQALAAEGFGILCEIDVAATMKKKLGVAFRPYVILGACNPPLAHRALSAELDIGLLLPCNVIVYATDDPARSVVAAMDPVAALALTGNDAIEPVARDAKARITRALESVEAAVLV